MGNIVYINANGHLGKAAFEAVTYAKKLGGTVKVLATGSLESSSLCQLGKYGANEVLVNRGIISNDDQEICAWISQECSGTENIVFSNDFRLKAGLIAGAVALPEADGSVKVNVFSGKAFGYVQCKTAQRIIALLPNSIAPEETGSDCNVQEINSPGQASAIKVISVAL